MFFKIKLKLQENEPNKAAFKCPAAKLYTFFYSYVYYALEFSSYIEM